MPKIPLLSSSQVCELARIDRSTLTRDVARGLISPQQRAGESQNAAMLFLSTDVADYIVARGTRAAS